MNKGVIEKIYSTQKGLNLFSSSFFLADSYLINTLIFLFLLFICFYLYLHIDISLSLKSWDNKKCNPKYLYFSGFIKPEYNMGYFDTTMHNFRDCMSKGYVDAIKDFNNEMNVDLKVKEGKFQFEYDKNNMLKKEYNNMQDDTQVLLNELGEQIIDISSEDLILRSTAYKKLGVLGVYMDQFDQLLDYIYKYSKNYLTYLYLHRLNKYETSSEGNDKDKVEREKVEKIKKILDEHFDGPSYY